MNWSMSAADRVAQIRKDCAARNDDSMDDLSDLEVLNHVFELHQLEQIATRDRYMGLLIDQRRHGDRVYAAANKREKGRANEYARYMVTRWIGDLTKILGAVEVLPERANAERVALLKQIAADTRWQLKQGSDKPAGMYDKDDDAATVRAVRSVVGVLGDRDGISADEVIRLVKKALDGDHLRDLFEVANAGAMKPELAERSPVFVGQDWTERGSYFAYEPDGNGARVVAYAVADDAWYLDLYSATGALLAYGVVPADQVAALASVLVGHAPQWVNDLSRYPWQRFGSVVATKS